MVFGLKPSHTSEGGGVFGLKPSYTSEGNLKEGSGYFLKEGDGLGGYALTAACEAQTFGCGGFDGYGIHVNPKYGSERRTHRVDMRSQLWRFGHYGDVCIDGMPTVTVDKVYDVTEEYLGPLYCGSESGKCLPISPNANAPSNASHKACIATSASLWPSRP